MRSSKGADNRSRCIYSRLGGKRTAHTGRCVAMRHEREEEIGGESEGMERKEGRGEEREGWVTWTREREPNEEKEDGEGEGRT